MTTRLQDTGKTIWQIQIKKKIHQRSTALERSVKNTGGLQLVSRYQPHPKKVSTIRKYHNHTLQTDPWHREEEPQNK